MVRTALARPAGPPRARDRTDDHAALAELRAGRRAAGLLRALRPAVPGPPAGRWTS
ncbi:hypothetical protein [Streptomyces phaeoluteigriseus]|uniref:hypothetical protein n=1 Tax=Streptomyces phaeoluteigriseus TaxID=114686 RepID=UPI001301C6BB|nr:hypothetical protein [Streptomyces phaeoluteigriseus]